MPKGKGYPGNKKQPKPQSKKRPRKLPKTGKQK